MFWGLIMDAGKRYSQTVERAFHISMACLEPNTADFENVSVLLVFDNREFILCNLNKNKNIQSQLDLNFQCGDKISFMSTGKGRVHLTGYLLETDEDDDDEDLEEEEVGNESSINTSSVLEKSLDSEVKGSGKRKNEPQLAKKDNKKLKLEAQNAESSDEDEEDDDEDEDEDEIGGDSDENEDEEEEEDEDDDDEDSEDSAEEMEIGSPKAKTPDTKKNEKQGKSPKDILQNKNKTPGEKQKNSSLMQQQKDKTPNAKLQQQKNKTPGGTPAAQVNGISGQQQSGKKNKQKGDTPKPGKSPGEGSPGKKVLQGGVIIEDMQVGSGPVAKPGRTVAVYYVGRLKNNKQFDATTEGSGFKFRLGKGEVIKGWDIGVTGMKVGGKRKITCPSAMAYGNKGSPPAIPPNSTLIFEVELKAVN